MNRSAARLLAPVALLLALSGCVAPIYKKTEHVVGATPADVQATPEDFRDAEVVWGAKVIEVRNLADSTEIDLIGYPIDRAQMPNPYGATQGRFIMILPGYVEAHDYPTDFYLTLHGHIVGTRAGFVDEHAYVFPLVRADAAHVWPSGFQFDRPQWHVGVGVGIVR